MKAYHFTGDKLRNGDPIPPIGEWLVFDGEPQLCVQGLHASIDPYDALTCAPGTLLHKVELGGKIIHSSDKMVATRRKIIASVDTTATLQAFARWCAFQVIDLWDAPQIVRQWLETGDKSLSLAVMEAVCMSIKAVSEWLPVPARAATAAAIAAEWAARVSGAWGAEWTTGAAVALGAQLATGHAAHAVYCPGNMWISAVWASEEKNKQRKEFQRRVNELFGDKT
jgi:hypothetical protein